MQALKGLRSALLVAGASLVACAFAVAAPAGDGSVTPSKWPSLPRQKLATQAIEARVAKLMAAMTLEEKVGQMIQADISSIKPDDLRAYPVGSILAGGNSGPNSDDRAPAPAWLALADEFYRVSVEPRPGHTPIPVLFGIDAVHGNNNLLGATIFPHNVALGAAHDPALLRRIAEVTADEVAIGGFDWAFAPTLAVVRDVRWGRSYESYGEEPSLVASYAASIVEGLQGKRGSADFMSARRTIATPKHFVGDGGTNEGRDQDDCKISEQELIDIHAAGYVPAIKAGTLTVMASFSSWNGIKMVANKGLLTDVLKGRLGFDGIVVSDWNAHSQVPGCTKYSCPAAINAGIDMLMAPDGWKRLFENTVAQVRANQIPMARVDDAVRRILTVKILAGTFDRGAPAQRARAGKFADLASDAHRAVAREAVRKSLVLLKNENNILPLRADANVLVAGDGADNIAKQSGGWTISWQGTGSTNADFPQGTSIYAGLRQAIEAGGGKVEFSPDGAFTRKPDVAIVVFGEEPYAEFQGDLDTLEYVPQNERELAMLRSLKAQNVPVVAVFLSGRPLWVNPYLNLADAFVAAWLPGSEGGGVADLLLRAPDGTVRHDFTGKLSFSWPRTGVQDGKHRGDAGYDPLFPVGYGLSYKQNGALAALSEDSHVPPGARINRNIYFRQGRASGAWSLYAGDAQGAERVTATRQSSPSKIVDVRSVDVAQQEDAKQVTWSGAGAGTIRIEGRPVDLRRQSNGDMAVSLRFRIDAPPTDRVKWSVNCGKDCGAATDVTDLLRATPPGEWTTVKVKLACFADAGADMQTIERPIELSTTGKLGLTFTDIRLDSNTGDAICPGS